MGSGSYLVHSLHAQRDGHHLFRVAVARPPQSWADLWSDRYSRRLTMLDDPAEVFAACLKRLGFSINSGDENELKKATRPGQSSRSRFCALI